MGDHYLLAKILEERARELSQEPTKERLVVVGFGATNDEEAEEIRSVLGKLVAKVKHRRPFQEAQAAVLYHNAGPEKVVREGNQKAQELIKSLAADKNLRTILIPFHLGFKHTGSMQMAHVLDRMLKDLPARYVKDKEILPHSNVALWLKRNANQFLPPRREDLGIVVMPHGAGEYYNSLVLEAIAPLQGRYNLEVAFGMADLETLQEAVDKLEQRGARRIMVLRLYSISPSLKEETEYVLGLSTTPVFMAHGSSHDHQLAPTRIKSGAILSTVGGLDDDPLISEVLLQRTRRSAKTRLARP